MKPLFFIRVDDGMRNVVIKYSEVVRMKKILIFFSLASFSLVSQTTVVNLQHFEADKVYVKGFSVKQSSKIKIVCSGAMTSSEKWYRWNPLIAYGWILNGTTREVVWYMNPNNVTKSNSHTIELDGEITLPPGNYEAYYSTTGQRIIRISDSKSYFNQFFKNLVNVFVDDADVYQNMEDWRLRITSDERASNFGPYDGSRSANVFVGLIGARNGDFLEKGFTLDKEISVKVYCVGEGQDRKMFDYGWITDDRSAKSVWEMRYENSAHAGGAEKNRGYIGVVTLPAGNYVATYVTDDSHSFEDWNMQPPYDPSGWGLSLSAVNESDISSIRDYKKSKRQEILAMTRIGDEAFRSESFSLAKQTDISIYAIGEGRERRMYDYGWIVNTKDGETVWEMKYQDTKFAGGSDKNRLYEGSISLPAGNYLAYYRSDGSHSYDDWNDDPPYNQSKWGLTLSLVNNADANNISKANVSDGASDDAALLAQIVRVGDDEYRTKEFKISRETKVRVLCVGEGQSGHMYDYGWIKNSSSGQTVWEMTYGMSRSAGGAKKNRMVDANLLLEPGSYEVTFISDGSHSYQDWNDDPPNMPDKWGISLRAVK